MAKWNQEQEAKAKQQVKPPQDPYPARLSDWQSAQDKADNYR